MFIIFSKKGSHVGVVLSFVIFVVFLVFLFSALQPALKIEKDKEAILEYISNSIIELSSDNLSIENIILDNVGSTYDCIVIDKLESDKKIIVKSNEIIIPYYINEQIIVGNLEAKKYLFKIYYSDLIVQQSSTQPTCTAEKTKTNPEIGFVDEENVIFISKFSEIANRNYNSLKQELGISQKEDFSFSLLDADKINITEMKNITITANIYVNEFPVLYSNENGEIKSGFINVKIW